MALSQQQVDTVRRMAGSGNTAASRLMASPDYSAIFNPPQTARPSAQINVSNPVKSTNLSGNTTTQDVLNRRAQLAYEAQQAKEFSAYLQTQGSSAQETNQLAGLMWGSSPVDTALGEAQTQNLSLYDKASQYFNSLLGRNSADQYGKLTEDAGLQGAQDQLAQSNIRLAQLRGEQQRIRPQIETEAGQTRIGAEARLNPIERNLNAEIASESLVQAALQGNVEAIQNNAKFVLDLQTKDEERNLQAFQNRIKMEEARVTALSGAAKSAAEKRLAVANLILGDRTQRLEQMKQDKKDKMDFALAYLKRTGDGSGAAKILNNDMPMSEVLRQYGGSLGDKGESPAQTADVKNYLFAKQNGYTGSFYDWTSGKAGPTKQVLTLSVLDANGNPVIENGTPKSNGVAENLLSIGMTTDDIIEVQRLLNSGWKLKDIAEKYNMPERFYNALSSNVQDKYQ